MTYRNSTDQYVNDVLNSLFMPHTKYSQRRHSRVCDTVEFILGLLCKSGLLVRGRNGITFLQPSAASSRGHISLVSHEVFK